MDTVFNASGQVVHEQPILPKVPGTYDKPQIESKPTEEVKQTTTVKTETLPKPFWQSIGEDIHVNASGLFMFTCGFISIFWKEHKPEMQELTVLAATYLFASAKNKN